MQKTVQAARAIHALVRSAQGIGATPRTSHSAKLCQALSILHYVDTSIATHPLWDRPFWVKWSWHVMEESVVASRS